MNLFDLIVCIVLVLALLDGWRQGVVRQLCSLVGLVGGIWLASRYGAAFGRWAHVERWFSAGEQAVEAVGFVILLIATILVLAVLGIVLRKLFRFVGFGVPDSILGSMVAMVKCILLLSVLFSVFDRLNAGHSLVEASTVESSRCYGPVMRVADHVLPFLHWVEGQIPKDM